jgi:hypothetical protein
VLANRPVARIEELLPTLEAVAGLGEPRPMPPVDRDMAAFVAARMEGRLDKDLVALGDAGPADAALPQLAVLAHLQVRLKAPPLPGLCGWLAQAAAPVLEGWHNRATQESRRALIGEAVPSGNLTRLLHVLNDTAARSADEQGHAAAEQAARGLDARLSGLLGGGHARAETALRLGQEIAAVIGLSALVVAIVAQLIG